MIFNTGQVLELSQSTQPQTLTSKTEMTCHFESMVMDVLVYGQMTLKCHDQKKKNSVSGKLARNISFHKRHMFKNINMAFFFGRHNGMLFSDS